jgi:cyclophilin family peptidyl-prolyl cis-trans isomerase/HEAT repeat protein
MELSTDRDRWVRFFAVLALGRCGDEKGSQAAVAATGDKEHLVRLAAVQSLVALKKPELVPAGLAKDASHHVRAAAAEAIGAGTAPVEPLRALREDASVTVRCAALQAHAKRQKGFAAEAILKAMEDANWVVREAAVGACAELGTNAEAFLEKALADKDERVRAAAIEAIGGIETKTAFETLRKALGADSLAERGTAVEALSKRKEPERIAAAWACFEACTDRKWVEVRESLVGIFARTATPETERHLRVAARDPALSVASKAARALRDRGASDVPFVREPEWRGTPYGGLRFGRNPVAVVETSKGTFEVECLADEAPVHVANFVGLAKAGFYDGLLWHRVVPAFVIQGGDPMGNGWGDAGWSLRAEINRARYGRGALGMPRSEGFDTGGCQLFFTHVPTPHLDGQYTVFGRVVAGEEVIDRIEKGDRIVRVTVRE